MGSDSSICISEYNFSGYYDELLFLRSVLPVNIFDTKRGDEY